MWVAYTILVVALFTYFLKCVIEFWAVYKKAEPKAQPLVNYRDCFDRMEFEVAYRNLKQRRRDLGDVEGTSQNQMWYAYFLDRKIKEMEDEYLKCLLELNIR